MSLYTFEVVWVDPSTPLSEFVCGGRDNTGELAVLLDSSPLVSAFKVSAADHKVYPEMFGWAKFSKWVEHFTPQGE
jgi:hypothetical protein